MLRLILVAVACLSASLLTAAEPAAKHDCLKDVKRVVFLGDSITHAGTYIAYVETFLRTRDPSFAVEFINCGLSSETVSGLSEPGHAGGQFPRPDVHERLERVLAATKPDLVVACYGMNCGIYHPLAEERFAKYRDGLELLRKKASAVNARVLHITPPVFDPLPIAARVLPAGRDVYEQPYAGYNEVLDAYAAWLVSKRADGWDVCDAHGPLNALIAERRKTDPMFTLAKDGVHPNNLGHRIIADALLVHLGALDESAPIPDDGESDLDADVLKLVKQRLALMHDAWLTKTGHKRPGVKAGLPLEEAQAKAAELERQIAALLKKPS